MYREKRAAEKGHRGNEEAVDQRDIIDLSDQHAYNQSQRAKAEAAQQNAGEPGAALDAGTKGNEADSQNQAAKDGGAAYTGQNYTPDGGDMGHRAEDQAVEMTEIQAAGADGGSRLLKAIRHDRHADNAAGEKGQVAAFHADSAAQPQAKGEEIDKRGNNGGKNITHAADLFP